MSSLKEELRLFRKQSADIIDTINRINATMSIDAITVENHGCPHKDVLTIQKTICTHFNLPQSAMSTRARTNRVVIPRQLALYLCRDITDHTLENIGRCFRQDMDHGTVTHACKATQNRMDTDKDTSALVATLRARCVEAIEREAMPLFSIAANQPD